MEDLTIWGPTFKSVMQQLAEEGTFGEKGNGYAEISRLKSSEKAFESLSEKLREQALSRHLRKGHLRKGNL